MESWIEFLVILSRVVLIFAAVGLGFSLVIVLVASALKFSDWRR